ncbi:aspartic ase CDR1-like [Olea europaea subsp. europaea]|uniref:Aspartic ase CDR1-like n=1 Tax=Olea europaea subsp. europaea TaxID=158383 RepID=A0A8S0SM33_OLEEU|nr:aspartic ase CDR1-like [Olea europaea subsp. europaea]
MVFSNFLLTLFFSFSVIFLIDASSNGITVDLLHRDSPLSPFYNPNNTLFDRLKNAFHRSYSRKASLNSNSVSTKIIEAPIQSNGGEYLMKISLGTPSFETLAIADTGSDLLWTQCAPCTACYKQIPPLFYPKKSTSYRDLSCKSQLCAATGTPSCDSKNNCQYSISYGDNSYSYGDLAADTLSLHSSTGESVSFPKTVFGCGHENGGTFNETGSGIVGLGGGALSIVNQLKKSIGGKFSYCLTQIDKPNVPSKISFGSDAIVSGPNVVSTPLTMQPPDPFYYLNLEGVSVGTTKIVYKTQKSSDFTSDVNASSNDQGNIIIDSGTTLTFLPRKIYDQLESALVKAIKGKRANPQGPFNLCYRVAGGNFDAPTIVAHFTGADVELPPTSTFLEVEEGTVCLTLVPSDDLAIYGNLSQMNYLVGYDLVNNKVSFKPTDCSKVT